MAVMAILVMACAITYADQTTPAPSPSARAEPSATPEMRIDIRVRETSTLTHITVQKGVRLRDRPDAAGPTDSIELAILRPGDEFQVSSCQQVAGQWWAYGTFHVKHGWVSADYLSPNPCK